MTKTPYLLTLFLLFWHAIAAIDANPQKKSLAESFFFDGDYHDAIEIYHEIINDGSADEAIYQRLALSLIYIGDQENAYQILQQTNTQNTYIETIKEISAAISERKNGDAAAAVKRLEHLLKQQKSQYAKWELACAYAEIGKQAQAKALLEEIENDPITASLRNHAILVHADLYLAANNPEEAENLLQSLDAPNKLSLSQHQEATFLRGKIAFQKNNLPEALKILTGLTFSPRAQDACYLIAECAKLQGRYHDAESLLLELLDTSSDGQALAALAQLYHEKGEKQKIQPLISNNMALANNDRESIKLIIELNTVDTYEERERLLSKLITLDEGRGWFLTGLIRYNEGSRIKSNGEVTHANETYDLAAHAFSQAHPFLHNEKPALAAEAIKYHALALAQKKETAARQEALTLLNNSDAEVLAHGNAPDEVYYLRGFIASQLAYGNQKDKFTEEAIDNLKTGINKYPNGKTVPDMLHLLGCLYYQQHQYLLAEEAWAAMSKISNQADALYWAARSAERDDGGVLRAANYKKILYEEHPNSPYAAEAYFHYYPYRNYIDGDPNSLAHLEKLNERFPNSPYTLNALYLLGLDKTRDRRDASGRWTSKCNLNTAIDNFLAVEKGYQKLEENGAIPKFRQKEYINLAYRARLERGRANLDIAESAIGVKKQIFLDYADELFRSILSDFSNPEHPMAHHLSYGEAYPHIEEEASYWLVKTLVRGGKNEDAAMIIANMLKNYDNAKVSRGYYLSNVWYEKGMIAMRQQRYADALADFHRAEQAGQRRIIGIEQTLELWIEQGIANLELGNLDAAMLTLSRAINEDAVSASRIRAMFLRASIYEKQGRHELAQRQLITTAKKGGEWGKEAKRKLEHDYGYHL
ncbi:MAG: tetratricopeptide repeat protein [Chlamydiia bacterium]|nr:tetratricopeptide repeat protein [Chlamydiia bacterium]